MSENVTLGELYRLCQRIEAQTVKTNGRVTALERDAIRIKTFWTAGVFLFAVFGGWLKAKLGF